MIHSIFPVYVGEYDLRNYYKKSILLDFLDQPSNYVNHKLILNGKSSYTNSKILNNSTFLDLRNKIQECVHDYCLKTKMLTPIIDNSWSNIMYNKGKTHPHIHNVSTLSGAYYPLLEENTCNLIFKQPNESFYQNMYNLSHESFQSFHRIDIKQDYLYIFPSTLNHQTEENRGGKRIVISFNTKYE
jgi:uncharacterized protein (TIGR02466 family)